MRAFIVSLRMMAYLGFNFARKRARSSLPNLFQKFFIAFRESLAILLDQFGLFCFPVEIKSVASAYN